MFNLELSHDPKASDIIQHVINVSGHTVPLSYLIQLAAMMGADVQLFILDNEEVDNGKKINV